MLLFVNDVLGLLAIAMEEKMSDGSFMVLCFYLSDVSYWKHGGEARELQCPETWCQWTSAVGSLHVQLQSASQCPSREPSAERKRTLYLQVTAKLIMAGFPKISLLISKSLLFVLEIILDWMINSDHDRSQALQSSLYLVRYKNCGFKKLLLHENFNTDHLVVINEVGNSPNTIYLFHFDIYEFSFTVNYFHPKV